MMNKNKKKAQKKVMPRKDTKNRINKEKDLTKLLNNLVECDLVLKDKIKVFRKLLIEKALIENQYNINKTASALKKNRTALYREISELDIQITR